MNLRGGMVILTEDRIAALEAINPNWRTPNGTLSFEQRLERYEVFCQQHGRHPDASSENPEERRLASWLRNVRSNAGRLTAERARMLDAAIPGWRPKSVVTAPFEERVRDYAAFVSEHGRNPSTTAKDPYERSLGRWIARLRRRKTHVTPERLAALNAANPNWRTGLVTFPSFEERAEEYAAFFAEHGRNPSSASPDKAEQSLASWLSRTRHGAVVLSAEKVRMLNTINPNWRVSAKSTVSTQFVERLNEYMDFRAEHGRDPHKDADSSSEVRLAGWLYYQRIADRRGELPAERVEALSLVNRKWRQDTSVTQDMQLAA